MATATVRVSGLRELIRAFQKLDKELSKELRAELRAAGEIVRGEAQQLFSSYDARSAAGYKVRVRQRGVAVEQSLARTTGLHPDFGAEQMEHALQPALVAKEGEVVAAVEGMLDRLGADAGF